MLKKLTQNFIALLSGALLPLALAPCGISSLAIISPTILALIWRNHEPKVAAKLGLLYGLGFFSVGISWVFVSIHQFGNAPFFFAILITILLIVFLALFPAIHGYLYQRFFPNENLRKFLFAFPALWVSLEWLRGWIFTGFPWLFLGYSQIDTALRGFAPIIGIYGVSFLTAFTSGILVSIIHNKKLFWRCCLVLLLVVIWLAGAQLAKLRWTSASGSKITISLIQGNIAQERKWQSYELDSILESYANLTKKNWNHNIIVWPEAAIPAFPHEIPHFWKNIASLAKAHHTTIIAGAPFFNKKTHHYYNGIFALGTDNATYFKRHLVPFGEFLPFKHLLYWLHYFVTIPMSGFTSGDSMQPDFIAQNIIFAPFVCYEIAYPYLALDYFPKATMILTISDDSWFGDSFAPAQHLEIARMRSLEVGRYQLVVSNTGITALIGPDGKIIAAASPNRVEVLNVEAYKMEKATPWVNSGKYWWWTIILASFILAAVRPLTQEQ